VWRFLACALVGLFLGVGSLLGADATFQKVIVNQDGKTIQVRMDDPPQLLNIPSTRFGSSTSAAAPFISRP
jgi:hypothetical protein